MSGGVTSIDARTGQVLDRFDESTPEEVDSICAAAARAFPSLELLGRAGRARILRAMSEALEASAEAIIEIADRETALGTARLAGELARTRFQLEFFAHELDDGSYLETTVTRAHTSALGPQPDLRRMLVPIGPVAVFSASNFPLAFSVPGGDTASALAAGNPVVVKAHESHTATSILCWRILDEAATAAGAPAGTIALVHGRSAGVALVGHPAITAVGFTGSPGGGRALMRAIEQRDHPIPFFGELGSVNPLIVTAGGARDRADDIAAGLVASVTGSAGQLCTKPGLVLVPTGTEGDQLVAAVGRRMAEVPPQVLLNERILDDYRRGARMLSDHEGATLHAGGSDGPGQRSATALVVELGIDDLSADVLEEHFGPLAIIVRYPDLDSLRTLLAAVPGSLTATFHGPADEVAPLADLMRHRAGRLVFDGFPTGVSVSAAQNHGGPWPSSNTTHTSVGSTAIRRFLRPVTWQNAQQHVLPIELRDNEEHA